METIPTAAGSQGEPAGTKAPGGRCLIEVGQAHLLGAAIGLGLLGFLVALPLFYFKSDVRGWAKLLGCSAGVGLFVGLVARARGGGVKQKRVTADEQGVTIENEKERVTLPWTELEQVNHWVHGGDYWEFRTPHRTRPLVLTGFGFSKQECAQLTQVIQSYCKLVEEKLGLRRMMEDASVF